jgi:hypothetical protein
MSRINVDGKSALIIFLSTILVLQASHSELIEFASKKTSIIIVAVKSSH